MPGKQLETPEDISFEKQLENSRAPCSNIEREMTRRVFAKTSPLHPETRNFERSKFRTDSSGIAQTYNMFM